MTRNRRVDVRRVQQRGLAVDVMGVVEDVIRIEPEIPS